MENKIGIWKRIVPCSANNGESLQENKYLLNAFSIKFGISLMVGFMVLPLLVKCILILNIVKFAKNLFHNIVVRLVLKWWTQNNSIWNDESVLNQPF